MRPTQHPSNNDVLHPPKGSTAEECRPLAITRTVDRNGVPGVWSYWSPSAAERKAIADGAPVRVFALGLIHPPIWIGVDGVEEG